MAATRGGRLQRATPGRPGGVSARILASLCILASPGIPAWPPFLATPWFRASTGYVTCVNSRVPGLSQRRGPGGLSWLRGARGRSERPVRGHFLPVVSIGELVPLGARPVAIVVPPAAGLPGPQLRKGLGALLRAGQFVAAVGVATGGAAAAVMPPAILATIRVAVAAILAVARTLVVTTRAAAPLPRAILSAG